MRSARNRTVRATASGRARVVDTFMDLYVTWRECSFELDVVYRRWVNAATAAGRGRAFADFSRALDAEEDAARCFADFASYAARTLAA
jgi:hypothetical protein